MSYLQVGEPGEVNMQLVGSYVWIPAKQLINNTAFFAKLQDLENLPRAAHPLDAPISS